VLRVVFRGKLDVLPRAAERARFFRGSCDLPLRRFGSGDQRLGSLLCVFARHPGQHEGDDDESDERERGNDE
jgi:hypothetical protein